MNLMTDQMTLSALSRRMESLLNLVRRPLAPLSELTHLTR